MGGNTEKQNTISTVLKAMFWYYNNVKHQTEVFKST